MRQPNIRQVELTDVSLQVTEWPGSGDPVLLLHATGFHSRCWDEIARRLSDAHLYAIDLRFHGGSERSGEVNWQLMAGDIEQLLQKLELRSVVGVGHSIGGYLVAFAAARQREQFKHLVLIDPVIFPRQHYVDRFEHLESIDPARNPVSRRKNQWRDAGEMYQRFHNRPPFDRWQAQILRDYCEHALREVPGENDLQLACDPLHEAAIYLSQKGNEIIHDLLPRLTLPITLLRAAPDPENLNNYAASPTWPGLADALPNAREIYLPGMTHFIPMEDPNLVASVILEAIQ
ncbi:MAG: alpha/beta hydrolase [Lysobacterales bacterium]